MSACDVISAPVCATWGGSVLGRSHGSHDQVDRGVIFGVGREQIGADGDGSCEVIHFGAPTVRGCFEADLAPYVSQLQGSIGQRVLAFLHSSNMTCGCTDTSYLRACLADFP